MSDSAAPAAERRPPLKFAVLPLLLGIGTAIGIAAIAPRAWIVLILDGWLPATLLLAAAGWGAWPVRWLGMGDRPRAQQVLLAIAMGLGILAFAALLAGVAGVMQRPVALALLGAGVLLALVRVAGSDRPRRNPAPGRDRLTSSLADATPMADVGGARPSWAEVAFQSAIVATLIVPAAIMFAGACLPPGILWEGEARGYDVLEYHLQAPREYFDGGRITLLPHNVYASFPQQMEMLYYLLMHATGDPHAAAIPSQLLHAALGVLAAAALAAWQPTRRAGVVAAVVGGSIPWVAYVGCLAYVELGMLFFAAVAAGLLLGPFLGGRAPTAREALAAGVCAGLAAGCKYQGAAMIAAALGVAWFVTVSAPLRVRFARGALFVAAALATFSPWLIRNAAFTGNPVYPFAYSWFGGAAWSEAQAEQWRRGHQLRAEDATLAGRWEIAGREIWRGELFGPTPLAAAFVGSVFAFGRRSAFLVVWLLAIFALWVAFTHMPGRFLMPAIIPLAMLSAGVAAPRILPADFRGRFPLNLVLGTAMLIVGGMSLANGLILSRVYERHVNDWRERTRPSGIELPDMVGQTQAFAEIEPLNALATGLDTRIWLVGRADVFYLFPAAHYSVVFNRDEWITLAESGADPRACIDWLRSRNVTHVVFSWTEIGRFRRTYGFSPQVTREWVDSLAVAGLRRMGDEPLPDERPAIEVFEVPPR